jgi:oxygen-independent coproporphyrinogen-3 oxidase
MRSRIVPARLPSLPALALPRASGAFGIYVHWPFCASKCPYCDFNSHVRAGGIDEVRFLAAYRAELRHWAELAPGRTVGSIFLGGGTPSLMSAATVGALLDAIASLWRLDDAVEVTLEANPSSVEARRFSGYRTAGVNRVSLGVQSLNDGELRALGRLHTVAEARAAIAVTRETFPRSSFDLIYARPGQTLDAWGAELAEALDLAGSHLSLYQLTIEPETPFAALQARGKLVIPDEAAAGHFYELTQEATEKAGLPAYEISNHAVPGEECRHNLLYWRYGEYVGVGAGAHGRVRMGDGRHATVTARSPERWLALVEAHGHGLVEDTVLTAAEEADEALLMGLRLTEGVDLAAHGPAVQAIGRMVDLGLLERGAGARIRATPAGRMVLNAIVLELSRSLGEPAGRSVVQEIEQA